MTLAEIAKQLNTSTMTIYRRLRKSGVNIGQLRDDVTGEITPAGASVIASMFGVTGATSTEQSAERCETCAAERGETNSNAGSAGAVDVLRAQLEGRDALIKQLMDERDTLRLQLAAASAALEREQADRQHERQLLASGGDDQRGEGGLFSWMRKKKRHGAAG